MTPQILKWLGTVRDRFVPSPGKVLEVGSLDVNGSPRSVLEEVCVGYVGIDMQEGRGVDLILDGERAAHRFGTGSFDTVVCCECLEHTIRPWWVVDSMRLAVRRGGTLIVTTPTFGFPLHRYPIDCYRFGEDAYRLWLFAGMEILDLVELKDDLGQPCLAGAARMK